MQVKSGSARADSDDIRRLRVLARDRGGTAVVIHKDQNKKRWQFFGNWGI